MDRQPLKINNLSVSLDGNHTVLILLICFSEVHVEYILGKVGKSCYETCNKVESVCLAKGHGFNSFTTTLSFFRSVNVSCKPGSFATDRYVYPDNPAYVIENVGDWSGRCVGFKDVPETINCTAGVNAAIQRLCPCKGIVSVIALSSMIRFYLQFLEQDTYKRPCSRCCPVKPNERHFRSLFCYNFASETPT